MRFCVPPRLTVLAFIPPNQKKASKAKTPADPAVQVAFDATTKKPVPEGWPATG